MQSSGGFDWDQEALLAEARGEAVALRALREALRRAVGLEGARQGVWHARVSLRLRHPLLQVYNRVLFLLEDQCIHFMDVLVITNDDHLLTTMLNSLISVYCGENLDAAIQVAASCTPATASRVAATRSPATVPSTLSFSLEGDQEIKGSMQAYSLTPIACFDFTMHEAS